MANKRYDQFGAVTPTTTRITLTADPATGSLGKCTISSLLSLVPSSNEPITSMQQLGSPIKAMAFGLNPLQYNTDFVPTIGSSHWYLIPLPAGVMTGVWLLVWQQGVYTATNFNGFALYTTNGTVFTQIATTANSAVPFKSGGTGFVQAAFTSPVTVTAGAYYLAFLYSGTSVTTVFRMISAFDNPLSNQNRFNMNGFLTSAFSLSSQTSLPNPLTLSAFQTLGIAVPIFGIY